MQVGFLFLTRRHGLKVGIGKQKLTREETFEAAEAPIVFSVTFCLPSCPFQSNVSNAPRRFHP